MLRKSTVIRGAPPRAHRSYASATPRLRRTNPRPRQGKKYIAEQLMIPETSAGGWPIETPGDATSTTQAVVRAFPRIAAFEMGPIAFRPPSLDRIRFCLTLRLKDPNETLPLVTQDAPRSFRREATTSGHWECRALTLIAQPTFDISQRFTSGRLAANRNRGVLF